MSSFSRIDCHEFPPSLPSLFSPSPRLSFNPRSAKPICSMAVLLMALYSHLARAMGAWFLRSFSDISA